MIDAHPFALFVAATLLLALTPGPNMIYLISRALCQGRMAGVMSWVGVVTGFTVHMLSASLGLSALFLAVPMGYELLRLAGAVYLFWLAWQTLRAGGASPFQPRPLPPLPPRRLFLMGLLTSILNPKIAIFYLSVLPQFIRPDAGPVLTQSLLLGGTQVLIGASVNLAVTLCAAAIAAWFARHRLWLTLQRYLMGSVLAALAARLLWEERAAV